MEISMVLLTTERGLGQPAAACVCLCAWPVPVPNGPGAADSRLRVPARVACACAEWAWGSRQPPACALRAWRVRCRNTPELEEVVWVTRELVEVPCPQRLAGGHRGHLRRHHHRQYWDLG